MISADVVVVTTVDVVVVAALMVVTVVCLLGTWDTLVLAFEVDEETILLVVVVEYEGFVVLDA